MYVPKVSSKKKKELQSLIKKTKLRNKPLDVVYANQYGNREINKTKMSFSTKRRSEINMSHHDSDEDSMEKIKTNYSSKKIKINWKKVSILYFYT